jgi:hypothetical protein
MGRKDVNRVLDGIGGIGGPLSMIPSKTLLTLVTPQPYLRIPFPIPYMVAPLEGTMGKGIWLWRARYLWTSWVLISTSMDPGR